MAYTALLLTFGLVVVEFKFCSCRVCEADRNTNGCSTPMGMNAPFKREFTPACDKHDICYGCVSTCFVILSCCVYCVCVRVRVRVIERSLYAQIKFSTLNVWPQILLLVIEIESHLQDSTLEIMFSNHHKPAVLLYWLGFLNICNWIPQNSENERSISVL